MRLWIYFGLVLVFSPPVAATELTHRFIDPNFGGNPSNGNFLMSQASAQDNTKEPVVVEPPVNAIQDFTDRLKENLLNGLLENTSLIDPNTGKIILNNTVTIGDFSVRVGDEINGGVNIKISDGITNTELTIPNKSKSKSN